MPATLAALSCALALLAASPVVSEEGRGGSGMGMMVRVGGDSRGVVSTPVAAVRGEEKKAARRVSSAAEYSPRRIHILATVEMLRRFFAFDLQGGERVVDGMPSVFAPTVLCEFEFVNMPMWAGVEELVLPQARESAFVCEMSHLPPPVRG